MYEPTTGRFNRLDPFAGPATDPQSLHKFTYIHGDPIQGVDPTGKFAISFAISFGIQSHMRRTDAAVKISTAHRVIRTIAAGFETVFLWMNAADYGVRGLLAEDGRNVSNSTANALLTHFFREYPAIEDFTGSLPTISQPIVNGPPDPMKISQVFSGHNEDRSLSSLQPNETFGPAGCGPCVGALIVGGGNAYAMHFNPSESASRTISSLGPFPVGSKMYMVGADINFRNREDERNTVRLMLELTGYAEHDSNVEFHGYIRANSLLVDKHGNLFTNEFVE